MPASARLSARPQSEIPFYRWVVLLCGGVPLAMLGWDAIQGQLGANSTNSAIHTTGLLSLVFLVLSLLMTPLKWMSGWGGWSAFRRTLGLYGFFYAAIHFAIYLTFDRALNLSSTAHEIATRRFLQIGTIALVAMVPLAVTSTNAMVARLGAVRWKQLHRVAYLVAILAVVHFFMQVKADVRKPLAFGAVVAVLLGARVGYGWFTKRKGPAVSVIPQQPLAVAATAGSPKKRPWSGELEVVSIVPETSDVKTFSLVPVGGGPPPFEHLPGQYLNLQLEIGGKRVNRSYTIASAPTQRGRIELSIKRESQGVASRFMHDHVTAGQRLKITAPAGKFTFTGESADEVLLIAGGVGITPVMSMARYLCDRQWPGTIHFLFVAKSEADIIFRDELAFMRQRFPRFKLCITLTRLMEGDTWTGERGRLTSARLVHLVPNLHQMPVYLCGPNGMMDATRAELVAAGVSAEQIHTEAFESPAGSAVVAEASVEAANEVADEPKPLTAAAGQVAGQCEVTFRDSNRVVTAEVGETILEASERVGVDIPYDCRAGVCGQCRTKLLTGTVQMDVTDALSAADLKGNWILACQACPTSAVTVDA